MLAVVVGQKPRHVDEHGDDGARDLAFEQIVDGDERRVLRLDHVENLVDHVGHARRVVALVLDGRRDVAEEEGNGEGIDSALFAHIEKAPKVAHGGRRVDVFKGEGQVQIRLEIHFTLAAGLVGVRHRLGEDAADEGRRQPRAAPRASEPQELGRRDHAVVVRVELQIIRIYLLGVVREEPRGEERVAPRRRRLELGHGVELEAERRIGQD
mmetsp:Transcript_25276/g.84988  ORF Transcript_25276/g.84988 Transcript_25276/m.84988 type:complete len:211 (-) Transcript_25276:1306-1938(-)